MNMLGIEKCAQRGAEESELRRKSEKEGKSAGRKRTRMVQITPRESPKAKTGKYENTQENEEEETKNSKLGQIV